MQKKRIGKVAVLVAIVVFAGAAYNYKQNKELADMVSTCREQCNGLDHPLFNFHLESYSCYCGDPMPDGTVKVTTYDMTPRTGATIQDQFEQVIAGKKYEEITND
jgi:hypothetical protein